MLKTGKTGITLNTKSGITCLDEALRFYYQVFLDPQGLVFHRICLVSLVHFLTQYVAPAAQWGSAYEVKSLNRWPDFDETLCGESLNSN